MIDDKKIKAYVLKNSLSYGGKASSGSVVSSLFNEGLEKSEVKNVMPNIQKIIKDVSKMSLNDQEKEFGKLKNLISEREIREGFPELPNAEDGIVMRFAPAPSGVLHVGHIISGMPSSLFVEKYGGKFYVRIEDTNPESIDSEAYDKIKEDCNWAFGNVSEYIVQSERMDLYYGYAVALIEKSKAYVCTCSGDDFREFSKNKKDCPCRKLLVEENIERWEKMVSKDGFKEGEAVLRFKSDMKHKNPAMRDFPLARINETKHPLQKNKYRVWPLMNLSVSVDDMELGMTHIIRGKDHRDNSERQKMIFEVFEKEYPWTYFMGRIKFSDIDLSKRKIKAAVEAGEYSGYDDKNLPTIISLRKRKYSPDVFRKFVEKRGLTEVDKVISQKDFFEAVENVGKE